MSGLWSDEVWVSGFWVSGFWEGTNALVSDSRFDISEAERDFTLRERPAAAPDWGERNFDAGHEKRNFEVDQIFGFSKEARDFTLTGRPAAAPDWGNRRFDTGRRKRAFEVNE